MGLYESLLIDESTVGKTFGNWEQLGATFCVAIGRRKERVAVCECKCGTIAVIHAANLRRGFSTCCSDCRGVKAGKSRYRHGKSRTRVHNIWCGIITRCTNPNVHCWEHYGGRGIEISERWLTFENFYEDMGEPPTENHEIDRIDNDGNYEPGNCRWATPATQGRNRRCVQKYEYRGQLLTAPDISELTGVNARLIKSRLLKGWPVDIAAETPSTISGHAARRAMASVGSGAR